MFALALTASLALHVLPADAPVRLDVDRAVRLAAYEEPYRGGEIPEGARVERRDNDLLIGGGMLAAGGAYLLSLTAATSLGFFALLFYEDFSTLLIGIPLAGPILAALQPLTFAGDNATLLRGLYFADAALQIGGVIAAIYGYSTRGFFIVYDDAPGGVRARLLPGAAGAGLGSTLQVTF